MWNFVYLYALEWPHSPIRIPSFSSGHFVAPEAGFYLGWPFGLAMRVWHWNFTWGTNRWNFFFYPRTVINYQCWKAHPAWSRHTNKSRKDFYFFFNLHSMKWLNEVAGEIGSLTSSFAFAANTWICIFIVFPEVQVPGAPLPQKLPQVPPITNSELNAVYNHAIEKGNAVSLNALANVLRHRQLPKVTTNQLETGSSNPMYGYYVYPFNSLMNDVRQGSHFIPAMVRQFYEFSITFKHSHERFVWVSFKRLRNIGNEPLKSFCRKI